MAVAAVRAVTSVIAVTAVTTVTTVEAVTDVTTVETVTAVTTVTTMEAVTTVTDVTTVETVTAVKTVAAVTAVTTVAAVTDVAVIPAVAAVIDVAVIPAVAAVIDVAVIPAVAAVIDIAVIPAVAAVKAVIAVRCVTAMPTRRISTDSNFSCCDHTAKLSLFNSYCTAYYCASLWNLESTDINQLYVTWRKSIRKILLVPYQTYSYLLSWLAVFLAIDMQIMLRLINFILRGLQSPNNVTKFLITLGLKDSNSSICKSKEHILYKLHLCNDVFTSYSSVHTRQSMESKHAADICEDLITTVQHIWANLDEKDTPRY